MRAVRRKRPRIRPERPGMVRLDADEIGPAGDQVHLAMECRNPEGMNHIGAPELDVDRLTDRNVNLVGRLEVLVLRSPPKYCTSHHHWWPVTRICGCGIASTADRKRLSGDRG